MDTPCTLECKGKTTTEGFPEAKQMSAKSKKPSDKYTIVFCTKCIYSDYLKAIITFGVFNRWGITPLEEAQKKGDNEIINILQSS